MTTPPCGGDEASELVLRLRTELIDDPAFLADVLRTLLESIGADLERLRSAANNGDLDQVRRLAHGAKGAFASVCLPAPSAAFAEVEEAARSATAGRSLGRRVDSAIAAAMDATPVVEAARRILVGAQ